MKNVKKGFTLIELILALAITVTILGSVFTIFNQGNKIFNDVNVKSDIQKEAQNIEEKINTVGMQASNIKSITLIDKVTSVESQIADFGDVSKEKSYDQLTTLFTDFNGDKLTGTPKNSEKYLNLEVITITTKEEVLGDKPGDPNTIEDIDNIITYYKDERKLTLKRGSQAEITLGEDVESITIKPANFSSQLSQADSVEFSINLAKKRGFSNVKYSVPINIAFRNKIIS